MKDFYFSEYAKLCNAKREMQRKAESGERVSLERMSRINAKKKRISKDYSVYLEEVKF